MPFKSKKMSPFISKKVEKDFPKMIELYQSGMSGREVADILGYKNSNSVRQLLKKHGLLRSQSEAARLAAKQGKKDKALKALIIAAKTTNRFHPAKAQYGEEHPRWLGDRRLLKRARCAPEGKAWREAVFSRDNWTCQECGVRGGRLQAHHIEGFFEAPDKRWDVNNGITLCIKCHKKTDNYGWKSINIRRSMASSLN